MSVSRSVKRYVDAIRTRLLPARPDLLEHWAAKHNLLSYPTTTPKNVANVGGERSYVLLGSLAKLEDALTRWTLNQLVQRHGFTVVVPPNIINDEIIEKCGFPTKGTRSQIYKISGNTNDNLFDDASPAADSDDRILPCIAGTSEFALASIHIGDTISRDDLPKKYCALSRCYRAEVSSTATEWGLYRVHYFNKVEMFAFAYPDESSHMHDCFLQIQCDLFNQLGLQYNVLDMPASDLGLSASRKYDIEAWMAARRKYGEISSTSNCKDYQSSRLNIKYSDMTEKDGQLQLETGWVHTINGTACSTIRTMIALIEQNQDSQGRVKVPEALVPFMGGATTIPTERDKRLLQDLDLYPKIKNKDD